MGRERERWLMYKTVLGVSMLFADSRCQENLRQTPSCDLFEWQVRRGPADNVQQEPSSIDCSFGSGAFCILDHNLFTHIHTISPTFQHYHVKKYWKIIGQGAWFPGAWSMAGCAWALRNFQLWWCPIALAATSRFGSGDEVHGQCWHLTGNSPKMPGRSPRVVGHCRPCVP